MKSRVLTLRQHRIRKKILNALPRRCGKTTLQAAEKSELTALTRKHGAPQALAERARIVLAAAAGLNNKEIAAKIGVCAATAGTWRNRLPMRPEA